MEIEKQKRLNPEVTPIHLICKVLVILHRITTFQKNELLQGRFGVAPEYTSGVVELCGRCAIRKALWEGGNRRKCYKMHIDMKRAKRDKTRHRMKTLGPREVQIDWPKYCMNEEKSKQENQNAKVESWEIVALDKTQQVEW